jgi:putative ABC transport system permease protein
MLKNYFKIAIRQLSSQKMYSLIKIGGFALSIAACILIGLFIRDEFNYDRTYPHAERLYRMVSDFNYKGTITRGASFQAPLAQTIKRDFPEVEKAGRLLTDHQSSEKFENRIKLYNNTK